MQRFKERSEVSLHLAKVFKTIKDLNGKWTTNREIAEKTSVAERTVRAHTLHLVEAGLVNQAEVFPQHKFQYSDVGQKRNKTFFERLEKSIEIFKETNELA